MLFIPTFLFFTLSHIVIIHNPSQSVKEAWPTSTKTPELWLHREMEQGEETVKTYVSLVSPCYSQCITQLRRLETWQEPALSHLTHDRYCSFLLGIDEVS